MKPLLTLLFLGLLAIYSNLYSQLPDGEIAPDWTMSDIDGVSHTLYDYLDQGKMVAIDFSATWCVPCWNYMQSGAMEVFWDEHGPAGDNTGFAFFIEADESTDMDDLLGLTPESQGNWVEACPFPIIDLVPGQSADEDYQITYYPTLYAVCPSDYTIWELGQVPGQTWGNFITSCTLEGTVDDIQPAYCYGEGSITIDYSGGWAPITFDWSTGDSGPVLDNIGAGTYSVTITENYGKFVILENIVVTGADEPLSLADSDVYEPLCNGTSTGDISVEIEGGTPGYEYDWSNGDNTQNLANVPAGNYTLTVTDDNGCTFQQSFTIDEPDEIEVDSETSPENCDQQDGTITLDITGGVGGYDIYSSEGTVNGNQIINLPTGPVTVDVEDANGCEWTDNFMIAFINAPEVEISQGVELTCLQSITTLYGDATSGTGDYEYYWTTSDGIIVSGQFIETVTIDGPGTYELLVTDFISGCEVESSIEVIVEIVLPEVTAGENFPINCENNQPSIQGSGDPLNTITWTTADGVIVSGGDTYTPVISAPGTYTITVVHSVTGCSNVDDVVVLDEFNPANAVFQYQTSGLTMATTDLSTGSNVGGWQWTFGDGNTSDQQSPVHTYATAGTYDVCLSVQNGCGESQTCSQVEVTFQGSVLNVSAVITNVLCNGGATGSIVLTVNGGSGNYTYLWTGPNGSSYDTPTIEQLLTGQYVVLVTDDQGNSFIGSYTVEEPAVLAIGASTVTDNLCNGQTNGSILVEMTGGVTPYLYSWNGGAQQPENFINQLPGGIYECLITDANGCIVLVGPYTINEPPAILAESIQVTNELCHGDANGAATITIIGGVPPYTYQWTGSESQTPTISDVIAGDYLCQVTDVNGCISLIPVVISEPDLLQVNVAEIIDASGPDQNNGSITIQVTGGTEPYVVNWNNGASGISIQGLAAGEYTYTITDAHGCLFAAPNPIIVSNSVATTNPDGSNFVTITPNPSDGHVLVTWKDITSRNSSLSLLTIEGIKIDAYIMSATEGTWDMTPLGLAEGIYIILLQQDEQVFPYKMVVMQSQK